MKKTFCVILFILFVGLAFGVGFVIGEVKVTRSRLKVDIILTLAAYEALLDGKIERVQHSLAVQLLAKSDMFGAVSRHPLYLFTYKNIVPTDQDFETTLSKLQSRRANIERDAAGF
jgi:hypothetical protein